VWAIWTVPEAVVIITCPQCESKYRYDEARFGSEPSKSVRCTTCGYTFVVDNPLQIGDATNAGHASDLPAGLFEDDGAKGAEPEAPELPPLAPLPGDVRFSLAVIAGAQAGSVFPITKPRIFIGRGSAMDVQLKDSEVSRRHAMIEVQGDEATLLDLGATNGTYVDGKRIDQTGLSNRAEFTVGSTTLMFIVAPSRETA
jgi:predicted Zn finger-like uncharacterized protein